MTHDPLCPTTDCSQCDESSAEWCVTCGGCRCDLIAKVRADERKQAGVRVAERPYWEDEWPENLVMNRSSAIDAAEGGDGE